MENNKTHTLSDEELKDMLTQAWRSGFLSTEEGNNAECSIREEDGWDELCEAETVKIMQGTHTYKPVISYHFSPNRINPKTPG